MGEITVSRITWQEIEIEVSHQAPWCTLSGGELDHIELRVVAPENHPLPLTETGYRSIFEAASIIELHGGASAYVEEALAHALAENPAKWEASKASFGQLEMEL